MSLEFLSQVRVVDPVANSDRVCDVILENGTIQAIDSHLEKPPEATVLEGGVLGVGLVDLYSRSGEPGHEERETLAELLAAAIAGGFTQVNLLPNTLPVLDQPGQLNWMHRKVDEIANQIQVPQVNLWGALTLGLAGQQLCEFAQLGEQAIGFSDGKPIGQPLMLRRILEYLQTMGKPLMLWPCDLELTGKGSIRDGVNALKYGLPGIPVSAETAPLGVILELLREIPTPVHLMRISTARSVSMIESAKAEGLPITASVTWHHVLKDSTALKTYDPHLRLSPPLGNETDRTALVQGIKSGVIDAIAIDHSAYTYEEKTVAFAEAPAGTVGYKSALSALWSGLVMTGELTAVELWRSLSQGSANCLKQSVEPIQSGTSQSLILFDPMQYGKVVKVWCS